MSPRLLRVSLCALIAACVLTALVAPAVVINDPLLPLATITCALWMGFYVAAMTVLMLMRAGAGRLGRAVRVVATALLTILPALTLVAVLERWVGVPGWAFALPLAIGVSGHLMLLHRALVTMYRPATTERGSAARRVSVRDTVEV